MAQHARPSAPRLRLRSIGTAGRKREQDDPAGGRPASPPALHGFTPAAALLRRSAPPGPPLQSSPAPTGAGEQDGARRPRRRPARPLLQPRPERESSTCARRAAAQAAAGR